MKKIFLTIAVLFTVMFNGFAQDDNTKNDQFDQHFIKVSLPTGVAGCSTDTILGFEIDEFGTQQKTVEYAYTNFNTVYHTTRTVTCKQVNTYENLADLNNGVDKFANLELAAIGVGLASGYATYKLMQNNYHDVAQVIGIAGGLTSLGLSIAGFIVLKTHSIKNIYVSDKGIGFKIDIK